MNIKKLTVLTSLIFFLVSPAVLGQSSSQQGQSNNNNWIWQILGLSGLGLAIVREIVGKVNKGNKFEIQQDISRSTMPITEEIAEIDDKIAKIDDKLIVVNTKFEEQEKENWRIRDFVKTEVGNLGDRLEGKINQTDRDLRTQEEKTNNILIKLEKSTDDIHKISVDIAEMAAVLKCYYPDQKISNERDRR